MRHVLLWPRPRPRPHAHMHTCTHAHMHDDDEDSIPYACTMYNTIHLLITTTKTVRPRSNVILERTTKRRMEGQQST